MHSIALSRHGACEMGSQPGSAIGFVREVLEILCSFDEGLHDRRIEMCAFGCDDEVHHFVVRYRLTIHVPSGGGVIHIYERHHSALDRDLLTVETFRVAGSVPTLVVRVDDVLRHAENLLVACADLL